MALSEATQEAVWLKSFMRELGKQARDNALIVYEDNHGVIALAKNPEFHKSTKHINIRYHFVREKVEDGQVVLPSFSTQDMLADIMTKAIAAPQYAVIHLSQRLSHACLSINTFVLLTANGSLI